MLAFLGSKNCYVVKSFNKVLIISIALLNVRLHNAEFQALMITFFSFRTAINVLGDSIGAGLVYHLSKEELENIKKGAMEGGFEALPMTEIEDNENK